MSNIPSPAPTQPSLGPKEAAQGLNEHGFLLQQIIRETIDNRILNGQEPQKGWMSEQNEYPVTATDGTQTRIDLVLQHQLHKGIKLCLECKRPNPKYKMWLLFDRSQHFSNIVEPSISAETTHVTSMAPTAAFFNSIQRIIPKTPCSIFNYYLEVGVKKGHDSASSTETIEKSLRQIVAGSTGLMQKLRDFKLGGLLLRSFPVLVTTAELFEAKFDLNNVSIKTGMIEEKNLSLEVLPFAAVNYHADDSLSVNSDRPEGNGKSHVFTDIAADLAWFQNRTVFIVRTGYINKFLNWAHQNLIPA